MNCRLFNKALDTQEHKSKILHVAIMKLQNMPIVQYNTYLFTVKNPILIRYIADRLFFGPTCKIHPFLKRETFPNNFFFTLFHINFLVYSLNIRRKTLNKLFDKKDVYFNLKHWIFSNPYPDIWPGHISRTFLFLTLPWLSM